MEQKKCLHDFFAQHPRIAVALSGGTDSSYLLYQAKATGGLVHAYTVRSVFQIESELDDAKRLADDLDVPFTIIPIDILNDETIAQNGQDRCYYCKRAIFYRIIEEAKKDGISTIADGTNASDDITTRPGMRALAELGVCSPLRECGITKSDIRTAAKKAGLSASDKPAQSCLATRIPFGTPLCESNLRRIKAAETQMAALGFNHFRVRQLSQDTAKIEAGAQEFEKLIRLRKDIQNSLSPYFEQILLDLRSRKE